MTSTQSQAQPARRGEVELSVLIVSWNTRNLLRRCLLSLEPELDARTHEVIVVDNASSDGSAELVAQEFPQVALIALGENVGFGRAVNRAARQARGRFLAVANADIAVRPGALDQLFCAAENHPSAGAFAPRLVLPDGSIQDSIFAFPSVRSALVLNLGLSKLRMRFSDGNLVLRAGNPDAPCRVPWAIAAFLLLCRDAWEAIGGFDEDIWMYGEDLDLGWRLHRAGWQTRYVPDAVVDHYRAASTRQAWGDDRAARGVRSGYAWMLRRRGWLFMRIMAVIYVVGCALRWVTFGLVALLRPVPWSPRRDAMRVSMKLHAQGFGSARSLREHR